MLMRFHCEKLVENGGQDGMAYADEGGGEAEAGVFASPRDLPACSKDIE